MGSPHHKKGTRECQIPFSFVAWKVWRLLYYLYINRAEYMSYRERITIEPGKRGGKPCIRGLRITVHDVLEYLAAGMTDQEILADFPDLELEDIKACLAFAADRERKFVSVPPE